MSRVGPKLDLPLEAVDEYFAFHTTLAACNDLKVHSALERLRQACTNLPIMPDGISAAREALAVAVSESSCVVAKQAFRRVDQALASKRLTNSKVPVGNAPFDRSRFAQSSMQEIIPGLFVGSYHPANDKLLLQTKSITHVCCCINVDGRFPNDFKYLVLPAEDTSSYSIRRFFDDSYDFIDEAIMSGGGVLIHCGAGISRSPTIAAAYIIRKLGVSAVFAVHLIASIRPCASPNMGFRKQLEEYEREVSGTVTTRT